MIIIAGLVKYDYPNMFTIHITGIHMDVGLSSHRTAVLTLEIIIPAFMERAVLCGWKHLQGRDTDHSMKKRRSSTNSSDRPASTHSVTAMMQ
jgi:hypothetical protein